MDWNVFTSIYAYLYKEVIKYIVKVVFSWSKSDENEMG